MVSPKLAFQKINIHIPKSHLPDDLDSESDPAMSSDSSPSPQQAPTTWTRPQLLFLVSEVGDMENSDEMKDIKSHERWRIIGSNCEAVGVAKTGKECRRKWDELVNEYQRIKEWEEQSEGESYWSLERRVRVELGLPGEFEEEVFRLIQMRVMGESEEEETDAMEEEGEGEGEEKEGTEEDGNGDIGESEDSELDLALMSIATGLKDEKQRQAQPQASMSEKEDTIQHRKHEMTLKLNENVDLIHQILSQTMPTSSKSRSCSLKKGEAQEFRRYQGGELMNILGNIDSILENLSDLVVD